MKAPNPRAVLPGSQRHLLPNAQVGPPVPENERLQVTVRLRPKQDWTSVANSSGLADIAPQDRTYLSREQLEQQLGASEADIAQVTHFAQTHGLTVVHADAAERSVQVAGTAAALSAAFGTALHEVSTPQGTFRGRTGVLTVPETLNGIIEGVFGLDNRPQADPHFQFRRPEPGRIVARGATQAFTPAELARLYNFPTALDGKGQAIGIIELGGGFRPQDLKTYFQRLQLPIPVVKVVRVDGAQNLPTTAESADGEVLLDIEVAAAVAPGAQIVVYFAPNTSQGFLNAVAAAVHDKVNRPSVLSISWGAAEPNWTAQAMDQFNQLFQAAALVGVTVCCAAGDNGSSDGETDGQVHVDFPSSSPYALACGGTRLAAATRGIVSETVWNVGKDSATGGGMSAHFPVPAYQQHLQLPAKGRNAKSSALTGRGLPDVAGNADPNTGYEVRVDGQDTVIGGTSAVAPLWAGLIARYNQHLAKPVGFLNPLLYGSLAGKGLLRDITTGNNGAYAAAVGWDACTGWGSPNGQALLTALEALGKS